MADSVVRYNDDSARKTERSMQSYNSAWMSHWTKKSYDASGQSRSSNSLEKKEHDNNGTKEYQSTTNIETLSNTYGLFKGIEKKIETKTSEAANESLRMTSTAIRNENLEFRGFPTDTARQMGERSSGLKYSQETCNHEIMRPQINHNLDFEETTPSIRRRFLPSLLPMDSEVNNNTSSRDCHFEHDVSQNANGPVKTLALFGDSGFAISRSWPVDFTASTSHVVQHEFDHGDDRPNSLPIYIDRSVSTSKAQLQHTNLRCQEREHKRRSEILVSREKIESESKTELPEDSCSQQDKGLFLQINPSIKNKHSLAFGGEQLQNFSGFRPSQSQSKFTEVTKPEKLHCGYNSIPKFLHSVHDMGAMRICTTVDSVVGVHAGHPKFSQTTHSFLITKKTDINLNKENGTFRNSRGSADGNLFSNIHDLSLPSGHGKNGELQPIHGFEENGENVNASSRFSKAEQTFLHDVKALCNYKEDKGKRVEYDMILDTNLKNESSAETDIMEVDEFEEKNQLSGVNSSPSNKVIRISAAPRLILGSKRDTGYEQCSSELPGMNFELPAASGKMLDNREPSTSRTESLDMETLLANAEHSESEHCLGSWAKTEPSHVWVKRLKLSASDSFIGTKNSSLRPCNKKNNLVLARNQEGSKINSEGGNHGKELMVLDKTTALPKQGEYFFAESSKSRDSFLSDSWIQRWRHGKATNSKKKLEPVVLCEPQSSKLELELELEDIKKKQFPSIAAMALMGRAMRAFQPCQFQKKGSLVVWY